MIKSSKYGIKKAPISALISVESLISIMELNIFFELYFQKMYAYIQLFLH